MDRNTKWNIPFNAVYATSAIVAILSLIPIGSSLAFEILVSLSTQSLLSTYMISIGKFSMNRCGRPNVHSSSANIFPGCVLLKRIRGEHLPNARWGLGRLGLFVNGFGFFYCGFIIVLTCFPSTLPVDLSTANWSPLVWIATAVASMIYYWAYGQHLYTPPVYLVAGHKAEGTGLQHSPS